jgi:hypothetical protein
VAGAIGLTWSAAYADNTAVAMLALTLATMGIITTISQFWTGMYLLAACMVVGAALTLSVPARDLRAP